MRSAAVLSALFLGGGLCAGAALAGGLPTLPTPTVPTVPITAPTLPAPKPVAPAPKPPVPAPKPPAVSTPAVSAPKLPAVPVRAPSVPKTSVTRAPAPSVPSAGTVVASASGIASGSARPSYSGGTGSGSRTSASAPSAQRSSSRSAHALTRLRASRSWVSTLGPASHRRTFLNFRLRRRATVIFTVTQVWPVCRAAGSFRVHGHAGLNRIRFAGRVHGRALPPGTYRLSAHVLGRGTVLRLTVVMVASGSPTPTQLRSARRSNACNLGARLASNVTAAAGESATGLASSSPSSAAQTEIVRNQTQQPSAVGPSGHTGAPSAAPFTAARISQNATNPLVILALGLAVFLLGLAAVPRAAVPDPRLTDVLVRHRLDLALAGAAAFVLALLALALA